MSDFQHLLPPVYFEGIRLSGTLYEPDGYGGVYFPVDLNIEGDYASIDNYNSSVWNSDPNRVPSLPFFASSGFDKYQYCLSPYSLNFPAGGSSRDPVIFTNSQKISNYTQADSPESWFTDGDRDSDDIIYENTAHPRWINRDFPSGRDLFTTSQMSKVYSMGFNPFPYEVPFLVPFTKCPLFTHTPSEKSFYEDNNYNSKFLKQFPPKNSEQSIYQIYFLIDNACQDIELDVNIINEHSLIKWDFDFGVVINNEYVSSFSVVSKESEELFVYDPLTGVINGTVPRLYELASGYCPQKAKTKYKIRIKDIPSKEGPSLVQIYLRNINYFMPNSGQYVPEELYNKLINILTEPREISYKEYTAGKELFYENFFKTPIAHHKQPWYESCKNEWNSANGRFNQPVSDVIFNAALVNYFYPSQEYYYNYRHFDRDDGLPQSYLMGNSKKLRDHTEIVSRYRYTYRNFAINFGGFSATVYDYNHSYGGPIKYIDLAPVAVEFEKITPIRRKKIYLSSIKIESVDNLDTLIVGSSHPFKSGDYIRYVSSDYEDGKYGKYNMADHKFKFVAETGSNYIKLKADENSVFWDTFHTFSTGIIRFESKATKEIIVDFNSGEKIATARESQIVPVGTLFEFSEIFDSLGNKKIGCGPYSGIAYVSLEPSGSSFKIKKQKYDYSEVNEFKQFSFNGSGKIIFGDPSSGVDSYASRAPVMHCINTGHADCSEYVGNFLPVCEAGLQIQSYLNNVTNA
jgi:hypothetical protein